MVRTSMRGSHGGRTGSPGATLRDEKQIHREQTERAINTWTYDIEALSKPDIHFSVAYILNTFDILDEFEIDAPVMDKFLRELERRYINKNPYHNWKHAVDVTHTVFRFIVETQSHTFFTPIETFSLLTSAIAHDLGHPGLSNSFLIKTKHDLAILHNDQSPLENMHCATLYEILNQSKYNVFSALEIDSWRSMRKIIISAILGTDMVHHFPLINKMQVFYEMHGVSLQNSVASGESTVESAPGMKVRDS